VYGGGFAEAAIPNGKQNGCRELWQDEIHQDIAGHFTFHCGSYLTPRLSSGFAIINQNMAMTALKAGKPNANHHQNSR
jgi:hypothetical protein